MDSSEPKSEPSQTERIRQALAERREERAKARGLQAERVRRAQAELAAELHYVKDGRARKSKQCADQPKAPYTPPTLTKIGTIPDRDGVFAPGVLSLEERYRVFRSAVESTVRERAPLATVVIDRLNDADALIELSFQGHSATTNVIFALHWPETTGREVARQLSEILRAQVGERALRGEP